MRILVTGANGFVGGNLVKYLASYGHEVVSDDGLELNDVPEVEAVCHNAAITQTFGVSRSDMFNANVEYPKKLLARLQENGCRRFCLASSTAVYGNGPNPFIETQELQPLNDYAESKIAMEGAARKMIEPPNSLCILRYCNVYGPGEEHKGVMASMVRQIALQILAGGPVRLFRAGDQRRDYVHVRDVCLANRLAIEGGVSGTFNCAGGKPISFNKLLAILNKFLHAKAAPVYIDNPYGPAYQTDTDCDLSLARRVLGYHPQVALWQGVYLYAESLR